MMMEFLQDHFFLSIEVYVVVGAIFAGLWVLVDRESRVTKGRFVGLATLWPVYGTMMCVILLIALATSLSGLIADIAIPQDQDEKQQ